MLNVGFRMPFRQGSVMFDMSMDTLQAVFTKCTMLCFKMALKHHTVSV